jgi:hypothetical protein
MRKKALRNFPQEHQHGPWPIIQVSAEDRQYLPKAETPLARRWRLTRGSLDLLALDLGVASSKGVLLGLFTFAVVFSFITLSARGFWWWVGWHWALGIGALVLLLILIGFDLTLLVIALAALVLSFNAMLTQLNILLLFIGCGVILRGLIEFLPKKTQ